MHLKLKYIFYKLLEISSYAICEKCGTLQVPDQMWLKERQRKIENEISRERERVRDSGKGRGRGEERRRKLRKRDKKGGKRDNVPIGIGT